MVAGGVGVSSCSIECEGVRVSCRSLWASGAFFEFLESGDRLSLFAGLAEECSTKSDLHPDLIRALLWSCVGWCHALANHCLHSNMCLPSLSGSFLSAHPPTHPPTHLADRDGGFEFR